MSMNFETIQGIVQNDLKIIANEYKRCWPNAVRYLNSLHLERYEIEDIYQDSWIEMIQKLRLNPDKVEVDLCKYLSGFYRNYSLRLLTDRKKAIIINEEPADNQVEPQEHNHEFLYSMLEVALNKLGTHCANIIKDFYLYQINYDALAIKYGRKDAYNMKIQKAKCLKKLKDLVRQLGQ